MRSQRLGDEGIKWMGMAELIDSHSYVLWETSSHYLLLLFLLLTRRVGVGDQDAPSAEQKAKLEFVFEIRHSINFNYKGEIIRKEDEGGKVLPRQLLPLWPQAKAFQVHFFLPARHLIDLWPSPGSTRPSC